MSPDLDTILKLVEIASILGGGSIVAFRLGRTSSRVEAAMVLQGHEISTLKEEIKTLTKLLTEVAVQSTRLDSQDKRLDSQDKRFDNIDRVIDDLRRGEGMIFPLADQIRPGRK